MHKDKSEKKVFLLSFQEKAGFISYTGGEQHYLCAGNITKYPEIYGYKIEIYTVLFEPTISIKRAEEATQINAKIVYCVQREDEKGDEVWYSMCSCRRKARFFVRDAYNADIRR